MRAIAYLLLGLLALTAARPACAMSSPPPVMTHTAQKAHEGCPQKGDRTARHGCAMISCVGCALGFARLLLPGASPLRCPTVPTAAPCIALEGIGPIATIPPPRPIA